MYEDLHSRRVERAARKAARRREKMEARQLRYQPPESLEGLSGPELDAALRRRIEQRARERRAFVGHVISFISVNFTFWFMWLAISAGRGNVDFPWPLFITIPWGMGLAGHFAQVYQNSSTALERREQALRREIALEKMRLGIVDNDEPYEKPKRDRLMRLSDDGELLPDDDNETIPVEKAKNG